MKITFEEFINLFNKLSNIFYAETIGTSRKLRYFQSTFTDKEFEFVAGQTKNELRKDSINGKFVIEIKNNMYLKLFTVNSLNDIYIYKESTIFEDGASILNIYVPQDHIDSETTEELFILYKILFDTVIEFIYGKKLWVAAEYINTKASILITTTNNFENMVSLGEILACTIIDTDYLFKEIELIVEKILSYSKPNMDYIQLIPTPYLMTFIDSLIV